MMLHMNRSDDRETSNDAKLTLMSNSFFRAILFLPVVGLTACASEPQEPKRPAAGKNRLGAETSPYLRLHKDNPVHWYAWGDAALAAAKRQDKPIFLSIGYSSCHWCHVMNRESFMDQEIADYLNEHFICVKVDREERPDVDHVYMAAVQAMTGRGGWPLSAFLLSDGRPFAGGTYFPPKDRTDENGRTTILGFPTVLRRVIQFYSTQRTELERSATEISKYLNRDAGGTEERIEGLPSTISRKLIAEAIEKLKTISDPEYGGTGNYPIYAPKFPQPSTGLLIIDAAKALKDNDVLAPILLQSEKMAHGGIYDHVGGGFHRYCVDRRWVVPHFEKMLYDQAQLISLYSQLHRLKPAPLYARVVAETVTFVEREMTSPAGLFYSALDADSEHEEGKFYVWTQQELRAALGDDADWVMTMTGADGKPNFEGKYILVAARTPARMAEELGVTEDEVLRRWERAKSKLLAVRAERVRPLLDTKAITEWNGLMVLGLVDAAEAFENARFARLAISAADAMLAKLRRADGRLHRHWIDGEAKGNGYASDYAATILALLAVHRLEPEQHYLAAAQELMETLTMSFWDDKGKGFYFTASDQETLVIRPKEYYDGAVPSANSLATQALVALYEHTRNARYREKCHDVFTASQKRLTDSAVNSTALLRALGRFLQVATDLPAGKNLVQDETPTTPQQDQPIEKIDVVPSRLRFDSGKTVEFEVHIALSKPWHVNANPAQPKFLKPTIVKLADESAVELITVRYPKGKPFAIEGFDEKVLVYEGKVVIHVAAKLKESTARGTLTLAIHYQACDDKRCLAPTKKTFDVEFTTAP